jgi:predicted nucleic acid-binding Zn ribbon protein
MMATNKRQTPAEFARRKPSRAERMREHVLSEWRGADEVPDSSAHVNQASRFIDAILRQAGLSEGIEEQELRAAWKDLAGEFIARNSEPSSVKGGHLVLRVTQPAMRFQLEQMKPMLLSRIRERLGENRIHSVKFTLG